MADQYWWCGRQRLYSTLPVGWTGRCARVQAILPKMVLPLDFAEKRRHRRAADTAPTSQPTTAKKKYKYKLDPKIRIDSIRQPRGIPNKFKARNEIAAGFEYIFHGLALAKMLSGSIISTITSKGS